MPVQRTNQKLYAPGEVPAKRVSAPVKKGGWVMTALPRLVLAVATGMGRATRVTASATTAGLE